MNTIDSLARQDRAGRRCASRASSPRRARPCSRPGARPTTSSAGSARPAIRSPRRRSRCGSAAVRRLHALARGRRALDAGPFAEVSRRSACDRPSCDRPLRRRPLFSAFTEVNFTAAPGGTRMDVVQTYTLATGAGRADGEGRARRLAPDARQARAEVARMSDGAARSVAHGVVPPRAHL